MGEGNWEKVERPEMCPCLTDLSISREVVTTAAWLQDQRSPWAEVQRVLLFVTPRAEPKS